MLSCPFTGWHWDTLVISCWLLLICAHQSLYIFIYVYIASHPGVNSTWNWSILSPQKRPVDQTFEIKMAFKNELDYTLPETNMAPEKLMVFRWVSFWEGLFSGAIFILGSVNISKYMHFFNVYVCIHFVIQCIYIHWMYTVYMGYFYIYTGKPRIVSHQLTWSTFAQTFLSALRKYPEAKRVGAISLGFFGGESTKVGTICIYI